MKISIILPVYNVSRYIKRCLDSVLAQTYKGDLECVIVNDKTPDNSVDIIHDILSDYHGDIDFRIINHERNKGLSAARNTGINNCSGDYIYCLDSDDEITPECIETLAAIAAKYSGVDIVQGNIVVTDLHYRRLENSQYNFPEYSSDKEWIGYHILLDIPVMACNKLIRKEWLVNNGLWFKEGITHEDEHWKFLVYKHVNSIAITNNPTYIYYRNSGSISEATYKDRNFASLIEIYREFLEEVPHRRLYRNGLTAAVGLTKRLDELKNPGAFMDKFREFAHSQLHSDKVPLAAKVGLYQYMHKSFMLELLCMIFYRPAYIYMRHFRHV